MAFFTLVLYLLSVNFKQVAYFPHGCSNPFPFAFDANHNGTPELYLWAYPDTGTIVYEHIGNNQYVTTCLSNLYVSGIGNGDNDSLTDIYGPSAPYGQAIGIWESRSPNSYPDSLVWNYPQADTVQAYAVEAGIFVDFDQDGKMNLIAPIWPVDLFYFENSQDNSYTLIDSVWLPSGGGPCEMVVADFDNDSLLEMVGGDIDGKIYVWENTAIGVDSFQLVWTYPLPFANAYNAAKGNDMDGDGRLEFIFTSDAYDRWCFTMFESDGNNSYRKVWQYFYYYGGSLTLGDVECGDVDGDGIDEMVTFGGMVLNVWKCVGPDSFVCIWERPYWGDLQDGRLVICDLNQNGLPEIGVSGLTPGPNPPLKTYIYEKMPFVSWIYPAKYDTLWANDTVNLCWKLDETTSLESLRLYIAHPLMGCWWVYQGLPQDTTCTFVVPDTQSNMAFKFWVAVHGYLRDDSIVSPPFYIKRRTGIEETGAGKGEVKTGIWVYPNPFREKTNIKYRINDDQKSGISLKIYDATGRMVKNFSRLMFNIEPLTVSWDGTDDYGLKLPAGVYFVQIDAGAWRQMEKVVLLKAAMPFSR